MLDEFNEKHKRNIEMIDGIYASIDEYLMIMRNAWDFRIQSNRAPSILAWKNHFIECKKNLIQSFESIFQNIFHLHYLKSDFSNSHSSGINDLVKLLPFIHNTNISGIGNMINISKHPQDTLIELIKNKTMVDREEINRLIPKINKSFQDYTNWISELEKAKSANYESMGLLEQILFVENNELGRELTTYVLNIKFETLSFVEFQQLLYLKK